MKYMHVLLLQILCCSGTFVGLQTWCKGPTVRHIESDNTRKRKSEGLLPRSGDGGIHLIQLEQFPEHVLVAWAGGGSGGPVTLKHHHRRHHHEPCESWPPHVAAWVVVG